MGPSPSRDWSCCVGESSCVFPPFKTNASSERDGKYDKTCDWLIFVTISESVGIPQWFNTLVNGNRHLVPLRISQVSFPLLLFVLGCVRHFLVYITAACDWSIERVRREKNNRVRLICFTACRCHAADVPLYVQTKRQGAPRNQTEHTKMKPCLSSNTQSPKMTFDARHPPSTPASQQQVVSSSWGEELWDAVEHTLPFPLSFHISVNQQPEEH